MTPTLSSISNLYEALVASACPGYSYIPRMPAIRAPIKAPEAPKGLWSEIELAQVEFEALKHDEWSQRLKVARTLDLGFRHAKEVQKRLSS